MEAPPSLKDRFLTKTRQAMKQISWNRWRDGSTETKETIQRPKLQRQNRMTAKEIQSFLKKQEKDRILQEKTKLKQQEALRKKEAKNLLQRQKAEEKRRESQLVKEVLHREEMEKKFRKLQDIAIVNGKFKQKGDAEKMDALYQTLYKNKETN